MRESVELDDKFDVSKDEVYLSGTQALVRLCLMRSALDKRAGLETAGYVTGYRGSPLGGLDQQFPKAKQVLDDARIVFEPALNEDLAATAIWGAQQAELRGEGAYDGVFCIWYGKGPGVDRSGDALRHGNLAGSSKNGGVLVVMGDDHTCESSTTAHQSEFALKDAMIPVLNPANVGEIIEYGLHGWSLSKYSGLWCGLKCVKDNVESSASLNVGLSRFESLIPPETELPVGGLNIRTNDTPLDQEARLHRHKLKAAQAYVKTNGLDYMTYTGGANRRVGIVSTGKSWMDTLQALEELGIDEEIANELGITLFKVAMSWPLEPEAISGFCKDLDLVIVVEEKRSLIEDQLKVLLYGSHKQPVIIGKNNENGHVMFQSEAALNPVQIAEVIGTRVVAKNSNTEFSARVEKLVTLLAADRIELNVQRKPWFCAGCPHNSSTIIPEGARAYAGIGCHYLVQFMDRRTEGYTHMGGEGANWVGESRFSKRKHIFQNIGDGTYNHSGLMAIRAAIASDINITFKLLYNDAVALTGGQVHDGGIDVYRIMAEINGMGVAGMALVSDNPTTHKGMPVPAGVIVSHREELNVVQKSLAEIDGVTVLVYEQTCAAEKRRRRKRGLLVDPAERVVINESVCEGCGDCGIQSNCVAILPLDTEFGRKRTIDQSSCNKDFSCIKGFCPSFVTVRGGELRKKTASSIQLPSLPDPEIKVTLDRPYAMLLTGVGGTGVVTIGGVIGMAAHLDGLGCGVIDMAGLAQKGGAVVSHVKVANRPGDIQSIRVAAGGADLLLGCDLLVSNQTSVLQCLAPDRSRVIVNTNEMMPPEFTRNADLKLPVNTMHERLQHSVSSGDLQTVDATRIANGLLGDTIASNLFMLGVAWQNGFVPLSHRAILRAVELNNVAVEFNKQAFEYGRTWVVDPGFIEGCLDKPEQLSGPVASKSSGQVKLPESVGSSTDQILEACIERRYEYLIDYQNRTYANKYMKLVRKVIAADKDPEQAFSLAVAKYYFKLLSYKDEYEVARLHSSDTFRQKLRQQFEGDYTLEFHLAPPWLAGSDPDSGKVMKKRYGQWMLTAFRVLAKLKIVRGTPLDVFGYTAERRLERQLVSEYEDTIASMLERLPELDYQQAVEIASIPEKIRGFGHVKLANVQLAASLKNELEAKLNDTVNLSSSQSSSSRPSSSGQTSDIA